MNDQAQTRKPLLNFEAVLLDVETTGTIPEFDRIVEIGLAQIVPDSDVPINGRVWRVKPGIPIPPEATAVNGILNEDVENERAFGEIAHLVHAWVDGKILVGWNLARFDLAILRQEFNRCGSTFEPAAVLDVMRIHHRLNPRDLETAHQSYVGRPIEERHSSLGDVDATCRVLQAMVRRGEVEGGLQDLLLAARADEDRYLDDDGKFEWRHGQAAFTFGKHAGRMLRDVAATDAGYLGWMARQDFSPSTMEIVRAARAGRFPKRNAPPDGASESVAKPEI